MFLKFPCGKSGPWMPLPFLALSPSWHEMSIFLHYGPGQKQQSQLPWTESSEKMSHINFFFFLNPSTTMDRILWNDESHQPFPLQVHPSRHFVSAAERWLRREEAGCGRLHTEYEGVPNSSCGYSDRCIELHDHHSTEGHFSVALQLMGKAG